MRGIKVLFLIQLLMLAVFGIFKLSRDALLASVSTTTAKTILYSFPNFAEAIIGSMVVAFILFIASKLIFDRKVNPQTTYGLTILLSGTYVILQECKIHNLGGNNVFDPMDIVFSILGLMCSYLLFQVFKPKIENR